jgi:transcription-repair coupling factor (superfamily II helicase)
MLPKPRQKHSVPALICGADARALAEMATTRTADVPLLLVLANSMEHASRLMAEMAFFAPQLRLRLLPDSQTLPYDHFSPHADLISERLAALWHVKQGDCDVFIVPIPTAMTRLAPTQFILSRTFFLKRGQRLDVENLRANLVEAGYESVNSVLAAGEFSVRGSLVDLFPMGSALPYRLDFFGDDLEGIKTFDPSTQRTVAQVEEIRLLPAREYPSDKAAIAQFRDNYREKMAGDLSKSRLYKEVSGGFFPAGIEYYLPLFFQQTATIFEYLPEGSVAVLFAETLAAAEDNWQAISSRFDMANGDVERPPLPPSDLFLRPEKLMQALKTLPRVVFDGVASAADPASQIKSLPPVALDRRAVAPLHKLQNFMATLPNKQPVILVAETLGRRETVLQLLQENGLRPTLIENWAEFSAEIHRKNHTKTVAPFYLTHGQFFSGFVTPDYAVIAEANLYQLAGLASGTRRRKTTTNPDFMVRDLAEMKTGDLIVHESHGIGRYQGLVMMDLGEGDTELMKLEYAADAVLYVPVGQLHLVSRYAGHAADSVQLHKLGSAQWDKAKQKAAEQARDTAAELLNLYAQRAARVGHAFEWHAQDYEAFADKFGFEETPDQSAAISAIIHDMTTGKPMDRLICGDVGFGKTEVALRAAFIAVMGGKQVAMLVPTTLLAEQHFQQFNERFADFPIKIAELSRFRSTKEVKAALAGLAAGTVDIVIGTHKLVQPDVIFKDLGLVMIDEEHRFGVRQKEQLKRLRANVDVLTLTATPIPRTLSMALEGLRDFSIIATAPQRRLAVKTVVAPSSAGVIREAILRELKRGGQVFFLHNEVNTIENQRETLAALVPEARIVVGHGQLSGRELEQVMRDFVARRFNVLLCSTIIETGIDVPNANTMIIHRADKFGLAQLHQLRGRVGRSHHQAYAYLLTPDGMTREASLRLEAIQNADTLGSGFYLAMHDLEIRGAGEVLGEGQSGEMIQVGFSLYTEMLKQAVRDLKKGRQPDIDAPLGVTTEVNLHAPALLPSDYCSDVHERLMIYKRLATADSAADIGDILEELIDRFGSLPQAALTLIESHRLRLLSRDIGLKKIDASEVGIQLHFCHPPLIDPANIIQLIQSEKGFKINGQDRLLWQVAFPEVALRIQKVKSLLKRLM